jgi:hypothetical protein
MGILFVLSSFLLFPLTLFASAIGVFTWRGRWRQLAAVPLLAVAAYFAVILIPAWIKDATSHNLFPFELGIYLSPTIPYMAILVWLHRKAVPRPPMRTLKCPHCGAEIAPGPSACTACGTPLRHAGRSA